MTEPDVGPPPAAGRADARGAGDDAPPAPRGALPAGLDDVAADAEKALATGRQMLGWWRRRAAVDGLDLFPLAPPFPPYDDQRGFFADLHFAGDPAPTPVSGTLQSHRFRRRLPAGASPPETLEGFVDRHFLARCCQRRADGSQGGFRFRPIVSKDREGRLLLPPEPEAVGADLAALRSGGGLEWAVLRVDILDFVRANPTLAPFDRTLSRFVRESAWVVVHEDLATPLGPPPEGTVAERRFGYAFLPREVEPNLFGWGPGKFSAVKQWRFCLLAGGEVDVQAAWLAAPRSEKVFDLRGFDPIYHSARFADLLSFGRFGVHRRARERFDRIFLQHHAAVHAHVVRNLREVWEGRRWLPTTGD